jgi:hypothetical protein
MNSTIENFVGIYENAFSKEYCNDIIQYFELLHSKGCSITRQQESPGMLKTTRDTDTVWSDIRDTDFIPSFNEKFWECYSLYADKYDVIKASAQHNIYMWKVQKSVVGQGYHVWHYEGDTRITCNRLLAWILYLNDVEEGGETEFLYYPKRIKPKAGTLILWPSAFTHTHRGNPPMSNTKYIVNGWVEY